MGRQCPGFEVDSRLGYLLKHAHADLAALHEQELAAFGINAGELAVLMLIQARPPESQQQVARRLGIDRTSMVEVIDKLEELGLVTRRADPADRRRKVVTLTTSGRTTLPRAVEASDRAEQQLLAGLSEEEQTNLRGLLRRIAPAPGQPRETPT